MMLVPPEWLLDTPPECVLKAKESGELGGDAKRTALGHSQWEKARMSRGSSHAFNENSSAHSVVGKADPPRILSEHVPQHLTSTQIHSTSRIYAPLMKSRCVRDQSRRIPAISFLLLFMVLEMHDSVKVQPCVYKPWLWNRPCWESTRESAGPDGVVYSTWGHEKGNCTVYSSRNTQ